MKRQRSLWRMVILSGIIGITGLALTEDVTQAAGEEVTENLADPNSNPLVGLQIQPGDEPLKMFQPKTPESPESKALAESLAHFMTGRIHQENGNFSKALDSYQAAIDRDPTAIEPYQAALPILLQRRELERARQLTLTAAEKNSKGYELVMAMAAIFARQNHLKEGISLIQAAMELPENQPDSLESLALHRDLGLYLRLEGNYKQAAAEYKIVFDAILNDQLDQKTRDKLLVDPGKMFDEFGDTFLKAENPELALKAFDEANQYRDARPGLNSFNLAKVFQQTGKPEKALKELQEYFDAQLQTRGRAAYELLKTLLVELHREDELLPKLEKMYQQDEHNDSLRYFLADEVLETGDLAKAEKLYLGGRTEITDARALVGMFSIYRQRKNSEKLLKVLSKAFTSVPRADKPEKLQQMAPDVQDLAKRFEAEINALENDEAAFNALTAYARSLEKKEDGKLDFLQAYLLGKLSTENDRTDDVVHFYKLAISMRNDPPATLYTELGAYLLDSELYDEAIEVLTEATQHTSASLQREKWRFLYLLSYGYEFHGDTADALDAIREAQSLQPNVSMLHYQEAWVVYHARRWDDAIAMFENVIKTYSSDKSLVQKCQFHLSNIYVEQGDVARGEKVLEDVLADDPDNAQANNDLGYIYADQGKNLERAEKMIRKALEQEPENHAYLDSLGWVLYKLGRYEEALVELEKATSQKRGNDATLLEHLGDCLEKLNRHEDARAAWKRGLEAESAKKVPNEKLLKSLKTRLKIKDQGEDKKAETQPESTKPESTKADQSETDPARK